MTIGSPIPPTLIDRVEYMRVLPECGSKRRVRIRWKKHHTTKTYLVECPSGEVYLQWSKPKIDPTHKKPLLTRK